MRFKKLIVLMFALSISLGLEAFDPSKVKIVLKPEPPALMSTIKDTNPNNIKHRGLPSSVDLSKYMPPVGNQGTQGSCVAWSTAYAAKSYQEYIERKDVTGWKLENGGNPNFENVFSPAFIYNQINNGRDEGSSISDAMALMVEKGAAPWSTMPYTPSNYTAKPNKQAFEAASKFRAKEFQKVKPTDIENVKNQLSKGRPVVAGLLIYENFYNLKGRDIYKNSGGNPLGGHAVTIVGYNDSDNTFKFINSWSDDWGDKGYGYVDYKWFTKVCQVAFVMIDEIDPNLNQDTTKKEPAKDSSDTSLNPNTEETDEIKPPDEITASQGNFSKKVTLSWTRVNNAVGYEIHRMGAGEKKYTKIGVSASNAFEDTGVEDEVSYNYKIASVSDEKTSDMSEGYAVGFSKAVKEETPPKVTGLVASSDKYNDRIILQWEPVENVTGYTISKWNSAAKNYKQVGKTSANSFEDKTAKKNGGAEIYTVAAVYKNKTGPMSDAATGRTAISVKPGPVQGLQATKGVHKDKVVLSWKKASNAASYIVYKYTKKAGKWLLAASDLKAESYEDADTKGRIYYTVAAVSSDGTYGSYANYVFGYSDPNLKRGGSKLAPPDGLNANLEKDKTGIKVTWLPVHGSSEYSVWKKKQGDSKWEIAGTIKGKELLFKDKLPPENVLMMYSVTSKPEMGEESDRAKPVSVVYSIPKKAGKKRAFGGDSKLDKFKGTWSAMQWDGKSQVKNVVLKIEGQDENTVFTIEIDKKKTFSGKYVQDSPLLDADGKVKVKLSQTEDGLSVEVDDKSVSKDKVELNFLKE